MHSDVCGAPANQSIVRLIYAHGQKCFGFAAYLHRTRNCQHCVWIPNSVHTHAPNIPVKAEKPAWPQKKDNGRSILKKKRVPGAPSVVH